MREAYREVSLSENKAVSETGGGVDLMSEGRGATAVGPKGESGCGISEVGGKRAKGKGERGRHARQ